MALAVADGLDDGSVAHLLRRTRRIALVGASDKPDRPSYDVMRFLLDQGYDVVPVNPVLAGRTIHGRPVIAGLAEAGPLDMVDLFRKAADVPPAVDEAIRLGARSVWMQMGIVNHEAARAARGAGLTVVMDRCPKIEWPRLGLKRPDPAGVTGPAA